MNSLWIIAALAVTWVALKFAGRPLIALVAGRLVGKLALAKQPDQIHLSRRGDDAWRNAEAVQRLWQPLALRGFSDAGTYAVDEMPGLVLRLLVAPRETMFAIAHEHPKVGVWLELATRYVDGSGFTASTLRATGLDDRPGHPVVRMIGASADQLLERMLRERPRGPMEPVRVDDVARMFVQGYAESMAWRKANGVSRREVVKVSLRKAA